MQFEWVRLNFSSHSGRAAVPLVRTEIVVYKYGTKRSMRYLRARRAFGTGVLSVVQNAIRVLRRIELRRNRTRVFRTNTITRFSKGTL